MTEVGNSFLDDLCPYCRKRKDLTYSQEQRDWQEIRRGRYVEFNLVHDKGTLFGLKTNGRIESYFDESSPSCAMALRPSSGKRKRRREIDTSIAKPKKLGLIRSFDLKTSL